ncbi:MAG TPA: AAA family ATPase [Gammaproteobacteria bacterium]
MYTEFFGLNEKPFSITPDPRYLYMSRRHADALAHLIYGVSESGGFIQLTGEVGTGKTTLIRSLLEQLPEKAEIALILNPQLTTREFLEGICTELRITPPADGSVKALIDALNAELLRLHALGRRVVLIVDEAQTLSPELLEQVRLLTNLETPTQKLLQIILIGQPELRDLLQRRDMRQIAQRITGRYHLEPLGKEDTAAYVRHRMRVAGAQGDVFTPAAMRVLYRRSRGIPRLINVIADRALLAAYTRERPKVDADLVRRAAAEVFGDHRPAGRWWPWAAVGVGLGSFALATTNLWHSAEQRRADLVAVPDAAASRAAAVPLRPSSPVASGGPVGVAAAVATTASSAVPATSAPPADAPARAEDPAPPVARLGELLAQGALPTDVNGALAELLALWGATYEEGAGEPCAQAVAQGLRCLFQEHGSIAELRRMNLPAALTLRDAGGRTYPVVIGALDYDTAELLAGGESYRIDVAELTQYWYGDHLLLWRPATRQGDELRPGMRDEGVIWLRESLGRIRGEPLPNEESPVYDAELESYVRAYQRQRMLTVDGIVGARTHIALLADLADPGTPSLVRNH